MATTLNVGDLAIIQYGSDGSDVITFVLLTAIDADTVISFTDKGYDATTDTFVTNEGTFDWTPGVALPAGTVVTIDGNGGLTATNATTGAVLGTISGSAGAFNLAAAGDSIFAYQGALTTANLLYGVNYGDDVNSNPLDANGWNTLALGNDANESNLPDELNPALNGGINASYGNPTEIDNGYYDGPITGTPAEILAAIADPANWVTSDAEQGPQTFPVFAPDTAPLLADLETTTLSFDELGGERNVTDNLTLTDTGDLTGATLTISAGFDMSNDVLNFTDQNGITGVYDGMTGVLTLTGTTTAANYQAAIRSITYDNAFTTESTATRTVSIEVTDGANTPAAITRDIDFVINNTVDGTAGADTLRGGFGMDVINGLDDNDRLFGQDGDDMLNGGAGNDQLTGGAGSDTLNGGAGTDAVYYNGSAAAVEFNIATGGTVGDAAGDTYISIERFYGSAFDDVMTGDGNMNLLYGLNGMDIINGEGGNDTLYGQGGMDVINGGDGDDRLVGGDDVDTLNGDAGADFLYGQSGNDILFGGADNDLLSGDVGDDVLNGDGGDDRLYGSTGNDELNGGDGVDRLYGGTDVDTLNGDAGNDYLYGQAGDDFLNGGADDDILTGAQGVDVLNGDSGNDRLFGGDDDDILNGGADNDFLIGQGGADTFVFGSAHGADRIVDFEQGVDLIEFDETSGLSSFSDLTLTQTGAHVLITSAVGTIAVNNSLVADFDASDFTFTAPPLSEPLHENFGDLADFDASDLTFLGEPLHEDFGDLFA